MINIFKLINDLIMGDYKWTLLGASSVFFGLLISNIITKVIKNKLLRVIIAGIIIGIFVHYGHEIIDPLFHRLEIFWDTPLGEPLDLHR